MKTFNSQQEYDDFCRSNLARLEQALEDQLSGPLVQVADYGLPIQNDNDLLAQYTRQHEGEFQVLARIEWDGHRPQAHWQSTSESPAQILDNPNYFVHCLWCGRRTHRGHMGSRGVCSGCQEYFFGVRY